MYDTVADRGARAKVKSGSQCRTRRTYRTGGALDEREPTGWIRFSLQGIGANVQGCVEKSKKQDVFGPCALECPDPNPRGIAIAT